MKNEFGTRFDRNGYAPSIMQEDISRCYLCGRSDQKLDRHEPFNGPFRPKSKRLGMWVTLCHERCHFGQVHKFLQPSAQLKRDAQKAAMDQFGWTVADFIRNFGKNWLDE